MHAQTNRWVPGASRDQLLASFAADATTLRREAAARALAPARGALLGSLLGGACWALIAAAAWLALG
jgi:hypothetical protein